MHEFHCMNGSYFMMHSSLYITCNYTIVSPGTSTTLQVSAAISGHTSTSASTTGGKGIGITLPTTLGTTSGDGVAASNQQPTIDSQTTQSKGMQGIYIMQ